MIRKHWLNLFLICLGIVFFLIAPVMAINATWTYSQKGVDIGSVALTSKGDLIAAGAGKIWLFSRDGKLLSKEPYGENIVMTPDGSTVVAAYYTHLYYFDRSAKGLTKVWDVELDKNINSIALSNSGRTLALTTDGSGIYAYRFDGTLLGYNKTYTPIVRTTASGDLIVGISQQGVASFNSNGVPMNSFNLSWSIISDPGTMALTAKGDQLFFSMDQMIRSVYVENGSYVWQQRATGSVDSIAITPNGSHIVFGTDNGHIDHLDLNGTRTWSYNANPGKNQNAGVNSVSVSGSGGSIIAGTNDGQILSFDSNGTLLWSNQTKDHIRHVSVSADGSTVVATGDETLYAFSKIPGVSRRSPPVPVKTIPYVTENIPGAVVSEIPQSDAAPAVTSIIPTQYSVINTPQGSPVFPWAGIIAFLIIILGSRRS